MTAFQYFETLNNDIKEKLIGLCLDKNNTESLSNDSTENYDNEKKWKKKMKKMKKMKNKLNK